jgi:hypothetical protein
MHNEKLEEIEDETKRKKRLLTMFGPEAVFKDMMRNLNTSNKKFLDAIRFKKTQKLRDFKRHHENTVKQLACSNRKKKPVDLSLAGVANVVKESE